MFVSSRIGVDLDDERRSVAETIDGLSTGFARAWLWERDGAGHRSIKDICCRAAACSDMLILLIGRDVSPIVQAEFEAAHSAGVSCLVFCKPSKLTPRCRAFLRRLATRGLLPLNFQNDSELRTHLVQRVHGRVRAAFRTRTRPQ